MVLFYCNFFMYFFYLFSSFYVSYVLSISSSSSFDRQCKLEGGKRFLSMSTCRTLTLGGHSECSKGNPKIHRKKKRKKIGQSKLGKKKNLASISSARVLSWLFGCLMNTLRIKSFAKCAINSLLSCNGRHDANKMCKLRGLSDCDKYQNRRR